MSTNNEDRIKIIEKFLKEHYNIRYNVVKNVFEIKKLKDKEFESLNDRKLNSIVIEASTSKYNVNKTLLITYLQSDKIVNYNPFREYIESLSKWDGKTNYINQLCETLSTENNEFVKWSLKRWLIALVGAMVNDSVVNETLPVLSGKQGIGKSRWIKKLIPELLKHYSFSGNPKLNNKDTLVYLSTCMVIDLDELINLNKKETNSLKEIITKSAIKMRVPFGKLYEDFPRRASFIGSINDEEFLYDLSGSRRFLCYKVTAINYQHTIDINKVYAQAYHLYLNNEQYWFHGEDIEKLNAHNEQFRIQHPLENQITRYFKPIAFDDALDYLTPDEIYHFIYHTKIKTVTDIATLGKILSKLGFVKKRITIDGHRANRYAIDVNEKANWSHLLKEQQDYLLMMSIKKHKQKE